VVEQRARYDGLIQIIVHSGCDGHRLPPGRSVVRRARSELGPRKIGDKTPAARVPPSLVDDRADRVRKIRGFRSVQGDFRNGVLALKRLTSSFEIDVFGQTLKIIRAPLCSRDFSLSSLNGNRRNVRPVPVGEADDATQTKDWQRKHREKGQTPVRAGESVSESISPCYAPDARLVE